MYQKVPRDCSSTLRTSPYELILRYITGDQSQIEGAHLGSFLATDDLCIRHDHDSGTVSCMR